MLLECAFTLFIYNHYYKPIIYYNHHSLIYTVYTRPLLHLYAPPAPDHRPRCPGPRPGSCYHLTRRPGDRQAARPGKTHTTI